ncbi:MAG TPA: secretin N-terminal domain-containing protein, partial [Thermoguttaceae bacterium]|nr:secretin N-terminal domain-containing protein [Thermoguttaceae bacterium]
MKLVQWMKRSGLAWMGLCLTVGVLAGLIFYFLYFTQKAQATEFKAYSLSHAQAHQIQNTLQAILPEGTEVLVDSQKNRLLISGPPQAHQIAQQAIGSLDRPPAPPSKKETPPPEKPQPAQPVMAAYACAEGSAESIADRLRTQWRGQEDVRIAADPRTSQVLVLAPPEIQRQIAAQLGQSSQGAAKPTTAGKSGPAIPAVFQNSQATQTSQTPQATNSSNISAPTGHPSLQPKTAEGSSATLPSQAETPPSASSQHASSGGDVRQTQTVQLWQTHVPAVESALAAMLGKRMQPIGSGQYRLLVSGGRELTLRFDAQTDRIVVQGTPSAVDASVRLLYALDTPPDASGMQTHVMPLSSASSEHFQRAVRAIQTSQKLPPTDQNASNSENKQNRETGESGNNRSRDLAGSNPYRLAQAGVSGGAAPGGGTPAGPGPAAPGGATPGAPATTPPATAASPAVPGGPASPGGPEPPAPGAGEQPGAEPGQPGPEGGEKPAVMGPVQVQLLEGLDVLVIRGLRRDVEQVLSVIQQIEQLARVTEPVIEIYQLHHVDCEAVTSLVQQLYTAIYEPRQGIVSVTALVKPNALLLIGPRGNVDKVLNLVRKLDRPVPPETQFRVFRLRNAAAETVQAQIQEFYNQRGGLGVRVIVTSDFRSNSLVVMARPRDMLEIAALIERLDTDTSEAEHEIRVFKLQNTLAEDLAPILQSAIGAGEGPTRAPGQAAQPGAQAAARAGTAETKSTILSFVTVDAQGRRLLKSGILTGVRITADTRANALVVSAPAQNMPLLEALIKQLDVLPAAEAQIKVFTIVNGDASSLAEMLQALFATQTGGAAAGGVQLQNVAVQGESSLTPLRFAVDVRTNSIIAVGTPGFLTVVEAILLRLDEADVRARKSLVYRLRNAPASDVANALNEFLRSERQVQQAAPGLVSAFEQIEREVVVVPEIVSNSLIVSATPRFYDEIVRLIEDLDKRPPMVLIQVLIAEVTLNNVDEFGVELGLQDSILFDRSILNNIVTRS